MEYCEKSTLRNCIDAGLYQDMDRVWRLFREMVEGLLHIHEQVNLPIRFCKGIKGQDLMIIFYVNVNWYWTAAGSRECLINIRNWDLSYSKYC